MSAHAMTHTFRADLAVLPERVFAALTTVEALTAWFAEHADLSLEVGGAFAFWGRFTYGTPARTDATQRVTQFEAPRRVAFSWTFDGASTEVTWAIATKAESPGQSVLDLTHAFHTRPATRHLEALVDDLWRLHLGNLAAYLAGSDTRRPDFADPSPCIRQSIVIEAPVSRVFHALTDPASLNRWVAKDARVDLRVGGRYEWGWRHGRGDLSVPTGPTTILALEPDQRLVTDWPDWRGDDTQPQSRVSWTLEALDATRTRVTLVHDGFARAADVSDYPFGWTYFMEQLRAEAERSA